MLNDIVSDDTSVVRDAEVVIRDQGIFVLSTPNRSLLILSAIQFLIVIHTHGGTTPDRSLFRLTAIRFPIAIHTLAEATPNRSLLVLSAIRLLTARYSHTRRTGNCCWRNPPSVGAWRIPTLNIHVPVQIISRVYIEPHFLIESTRHQSPHSYIHTRVAPGKRYRKSVQSLEPF